MGMTFNSSYKAKECYTDYGRIKLVLMSCWWGYQNAICTLYVRARKERKYRVDGVDELKHLQWIWLCYFRVKELIKKLWEKVIKIIIIIFCQQDNFTFVHSIYFHVKRIHPIVEIKVNKYNQLNPQVLGSDSWIVCRSEKPKLSERAK